MDECQRGATGGKYNMLERVFQSLKIFPNIGNAVESGEGGRGEGGDCLNHGLRGLHGLVLGTGWREDILWRGGSISIRRIGRRNASSSGDGARMVEPIPVGGIAT